MSLRETRDLEAPKLGAGQDLAAEASRAGAPRIWQDMAFVTELGSPRVDRCVVPTSESVSLRTSLTVNTDREWVTGLVTL